MTVQVGQVYASTDLRDVKRGIRQRRHIVSVEERAVYVRTEGVRVITRLRVVGGVVAGHRLVEDVAS